MEKYKPIIKNYKKFKKQAKKHPKQGIRKNKIKAQPKFAKRLKKHFKIQKTNWNNKIYTTKTKKPGKTLLHWRGEYYVQEESATLPVHIMNPQPQEKILDMCSAPGGKTTQIADKMNNKGLIIANDKSQQRMKSLHANTYRTGAKIINTTNYDGRNMPENQKYDKTLVDAPCTGEGNRYYRNYKPAKKQESIQLQKLQKQLLKKANKLTKPGGTITYSTCTINPKENEEVINKTLKQEKIKLEKINTKAKHTKGITQYKDKKYSQELEKTIRIYPHHLQSGVIFIAKLRKTT